MPRSTSEIIDQAIRENRFWEILLFVLSGLFVVIGVIIIFWALVRHETVISIIGGVESAFFWPVLNFAMRIRRTNIMIRLLEVPLERARTADEAAQMLFRVFEKNFQDVASPTIQQKGASEH
jgi:hypothetical protein